MALVLPRSIAGSLLALVLPASGALAKNRLIDPNAIGSRGVGQGVNFYSLEKEIPLGRRMAQQVEREGEIVNDPVIAEYVNRVGQNLIRNSDAKVPFTIKVLDSEEVNAFALPGGFLFVNAGLILSADSEAELAAVMAHEIAHVAARHWARQATRVALLKYASLALIFWRGWSGLPVQAAAAASVPLAFLRFSRVFELESDQLGLQYLYKTGYDPAAFVDFFQTMEMLERTKPGPLASVLSTHPMTGDRIRRAQRQIRDYLSAKPLYVLNTSEFTAIRDRLTSIEERRILDRNREIGRALARRISGEMSAGRATGPVLPRVRYRLR